MGKLRDLIYEKWNIMPDDNAYAKMYDDQLKVYNDPRTAWKATETQWKAGTGQNRFKTFQVFLCFKTRRNKMMVSSRYVRTEFDSKYNFII